MAPTKVPRREARIGPRKAPTKATGTQLTHTTRTKETENKLPSPTELHPLPAARASSLR